VSIAVSSSPVTSAILGRSRSIRRGEKAGATSRRSRVCSGGSWMVMAEPPGGSTVSRGVSGPTAAARLNRRSVSSALLSA
jgi:hypothetical protein